MSEVFSEIGKRMQGTARIKLNPAKYAVTVRRTGMGREDCKEKKIPLQLVNTQRGLTPWIASQ